MSHAGGGRRVLQWTPIGCRRPGDDLIKDSLRLFTDSTETTPELVQVLVARVFVGPSSPYTRPDDTKPKTCVTKAISAHERGSAATDAAHDANGIPSETPIADKIVCARGSAALNFGEAEDRSRWNPRK